MTTRNIGSYFGKSFEKFLKMVIVNRLHFGQNRKFILK